MAFSPTSPEDGCFWRALDAAEVARFKNASQVYGRGPGLGPAGLVDLLLLKSLADKKCERFFWEKSKAVLWAKAQGAGRKVLRVPVAGLVQGTDFDVYPPTTDIVLDGKVARQLGTLHDPDNVP